MQHMGFPGKSGKSSTADNEVAEAGVPEVDTEEAQWPQETDRKDSGARSGIRQHGVK